MKRLPFLSVFLISVCWIEAAQSQTFSAAQTIVTAGASDSSRITRGNFSFGFSQLQTVNRFELGIWYSSDPTRFLAWRAAAAAGSSPIISGSTARLTNNGDLIVAGPDADNNSSPIWSSGTAGQGAVTVQLLDTGNLILQNSSNGIVWSSFNNPTNTLLPNQSLVVAGPNLTSDDSRTHTLSMDPSGNLTLRWNRMIAYWSSDTDSSNSSLAPTFAAADSTGVLRLFFNSSSSSNIAKQFFAVDFGPGQLRRLTLDSDGNLRFYTLTSSSSWSQQWQAVSDQCKVFNHCGIYGICSYRAGTTSTVCNCPRGLRFVNSADRSGGCTNAGNISQCATSNNRMVEITNTAWLSNGALTTFNANQEQCKNSCLGDDGCIGVLVPNDGSGDCTQLRSSTLSGHSSPSIQSNSFLKVCNGAADSPPTTSDDKPAGSESSGRAVGIAIAVTIAGLVAAEGVLGFILYRRHKRNADKSSARDSLLHYASGAPIRFSYKELQNATYNFRDKIGEGGFGAVYKGFLPLPGGKSAIAVKKLEGVFQGEKEFRTEVATIGGTHHMNLMHLVGFCSEGEETRLLVYNYMPNGSLDRFLFHHSHDRRRTLEDEEGSVQSSDSDGGQTLDWETRFRIALGAARGLAYLHEECRETIVHCDLKPENILLDEAFSPKVSDFGLARLIHEGKTRDLTTVRGTRGYMAPEWLANMPVTNKSDVYSYGMILLELVGGRRNFDSCSAVPRDRQRYPGWAFREVAAGRVLGVLDERIEEQSVEVWKVERVLKLAFWCVQDSPANRPSMSKVVQMLEGNLEVLQPPMPRLARDAPSSSSSAATSSSAPSSLSSSSGVSSSLASNSSAAAVEDARHVYSLTGR